MMLAPELRQLRRLDARYKGWPVLAATLVLLAAPMRAPGADGAPGSAPQPISPQEQHGLSDQARALRQQAAEIRHAADARLAQTNAACYKKFFVASCLEDARKAHVKATQEAHRLDNQAGDMERQARRRRRLSDEQERARRSEEKEDEARRGRAEREDQAREAAAREAQQARRLEEGKSRAVRELQGRQQKEMEKARERADKAAQAHQRAEAAQRQRAELERKLEERERKKAEKAARSSASPPPVPPVAP